MFILFKLNILKIFFIHCFILFFYYKSLIILIPCLIVSSHNSGDNNSLDENAISEITPSETKTGNNIIRNHHGHTPSQLGSEKSYPNNMKNGTKRQAPKHPPHYGGNNIPPAKLIAPPPLGNKPLKNGSHILDSDDASSGLLSHDSMDTKRQNDLNKCNAVYSYEQIPKIITPPHITNLETSEL